jgi:hypothetical protein
MTMVGNRDPFFVYQCERLVALAAVKPEQAWVGDTCVDLVLHGLQSSL